MPCPGPGCSRCWLRRLPSSARCSRRSASMASPLTAVTQRTRELAVRLALGARPAELLLMVIRQGVAWTVVGLLLGVAGSIALSRYLQGVLFGITPVDPTTFAVVSAMFLVVAILATLIPARRIARVDPLVALRTP